MPHQPVPETSASVGARPALPAPGSSGRAELNPDQLDALLTRARAILAGRVRPPALVVPPGVEAFLQREFAGREPPPTPQAVRRVAERLSLQTEYGGRPVACFTTADGSIAVLAAGEHEVEALLRGLPEDEAARVVVTDSDTF